MEPVTKTIAVPESTHELLRIMAFNDRETIGDEVTTLVVREAASRNIKLPELQPVEPAKE